MFGWILNFAYLGLLTALSPLLLYRSLVLGKYKSGWRAKVLGDVLSGSASPSHAEPMTNGPRPLWFHAVSVGEVLQLQPVLEAMSLARPDSPIVISTTTATGYDVALKKYPQHRVIYFPLDFTWAVSRALDQVRPAAVVLVELELWPNFIMAAATRQVPVLLINGRLSERSHRGYRWIRPLMGGLLRRLSLLAVQDEAIAGRMRDLLGLGESAATPLVPLHVTGSIKFDGVLTNRDNPRTVELRKSFGLLAQQPVFMAGSTQEPEERYALETWLTLRPKHPSLRLVLVPRHKERFEEVAGLVTETFRLPLIRRSSLQSGQPLPAEAAQAVILLDTLGELSAAWGLADVAFVGGSLTKRGGQNMLEPAGFGAAVLFGPNTQNFREIVRTLLAEQAATVVETPEALTTTVDKFLSHPDLGAASGLRARALIERHRGATRRTADLMLQTLGHFTQRSRVA